MPGRPKIFDTQEVIQKATELFWAKGYEATSTEELLAAMGIGKGSFYLAFEGGKKELFEKALEQFNNNALKQLKQDLAESTNQVELLRNFFRSIAHSPKEAHLTGCFMGNTIAELANIDPTLKDKAVGMLKQLEEVFCKTIQAAQANGQLQTKEDAALLARYLITVWNGLNITRRMHPDTQALQSLIEIQLKVLE